MARKPDTPPLLGAYGTIGAMILRISSMDEMLDKMDHMGRWVQVMTQPLSAGG